jgi:hypothetical protein
MYSVVLLADDPTWKAEVISRVDALVEEITNGTATVSWQGDNEMPDENEPGQCVVVLLASVGQKSDPSVELALATAETNAFAIVPMLRAHDTAENVLPSRVAHLNAAHWDEANTVAVWSVVRALGLTEEGRRIFLSYRRTDTSILAEQLHTALTQHGFDVFLDRFGVKIGDNFQRRIDIELSNKAFVLILESQNVNDSPWVHHEITYALANGLAILGVALPGLPATSLVRTLDGSARYRLVESEMDGDHLTDNALNDVLEQVEREHSRLLRRRRNQILGGLRDFLFMNGCNVEMVDEWAVLASAEGKVPEVFSVTPFAPEPADLHRIDLVRRRLTGEHETKHRGTLVHESVDLDPDLAELIEWVGSSHDLASVLLRSGVGELLDAEP